MSVEFIVLVAAFLFLMGWFIDALLQEERLLTSAYIYLIDGDWRYLPERAIEQTGRAFDRILGPIFSLRCISIVAIYSVACNFTIIFPTAIDIRNLDLQGFIDAIILMVGVCSSGIIHDFVSISITRAIIKIRAKSINKIIIDSLIALFLWISTSSFISSSGIIMLVIWGVIGDGNLTHSDVLPQLWHEYKFALNVYISSYFHIDNIENYVVNLNIVKLASATTMFPTLSYIVIMLLSYLFLLFFKFSHRPASLFLNLLSNIPPRRITIITSGLSAFIILLQAWITFQGRGYS